MYTLSTCLQLLVLNSVTFLNLQKCVSLYLVAKKNTKWCIYPSSLNSICTIILQKYVNVVTWDTPTRSQLISLTEEFYSKTCFEVSSTDLFLLDATCCPACTAMSGIVVIVTLKLSSALDVLRKHCF